MLESLQTTQDNLTGNSIGYDLYIFGNSTIINTPTARCMAGGRKGIGGGRQLIYVGTTIIGIRELGGLGVKHHIHPIGIQKLWHIPVPPQHIHIILAFPATCDTFPGTHHTVSYQEEHTLGRDN